ncbi:hypothetical protein IWW36_000131 [Coemansia brasiliensis]|uniref:Uncharacterized protein n=1 Tax=Coemansia brasiliensis TaxID=2650707 RepID=A0A9W8IJ20_9FUNG|nr:hypothetical protein IWW36_000131 [Coemansia brasiliensis]
MFLRISNPVGRRVRVAGLYSVLPVSSQQRLYTNTSVYTRGDHMSHEQQLQALMEEHQYLTDLLKTDDSDAPWRKEHVETVSREVQENLHMPVWRPEQVFHG